MLSTGLLFSCVALVINGLLLLGIVSGKAGVPANLMVGAMQVVFPTVMLIQAGSDPAVAIAASSSYVFGFTYLYVAFNEITGASGEGLGWFSLFVTGATIVFSVLNFAAGSLTYGVLWLGWSFLWFLFFLLLALGRERIGPMAGWLTILIGVFTVGASGVLELAGIFPNTVAAAWLATLLIVVLTLIAWALGRAHQQASGETPDIEESRIAERAEALD